MSENTKIEWCDHTFNPWIGCTKVSPMGCANCYAEADFDKRRHRVVWGAGQPRIRTKTWGDPVRWNKQADAFFTEHGRRQRVFCASLADVFDNEVDPAWRNDLFSLIEETPNLDWLLLTKRIGNVANMVAGGRFFPSHWPNVWIGATIVNQEEADRDIPKLLAVPAAKRFLSMEPLLGPVKLRWEWVSRGRPLGGGPACSLHEPWKEVEPDPAVDWIIVGGESGPNARPMHPNWARSLRDQCEAVGVPFLFKQWGEWTPGENVERKSGSVSIAFLRNNSWSIHFELLENTESYFSDEPDVYRVGKKSAGRLLDGIEWNGVPA